MLAAGTTRATWGSAAFAGAWCACFLVGAEPAALAAVPLVVAGVLVLPRTPVAGALLMAAATLVSTLAGTRYGSVDTVAGTFLALVAVGRRLPSVVVGLLLVLASALASSLRGGLGVDTLAVTLGVYGSVWAFGRVVRARALAAEEAVAETERLAATDPARVGELLAAEERRRLANETLSALRHAVIDMGSAARAARRHPGRPEIALIRTRGEEAIAELRELIGLLRDPAPVGGTGDPVVRWWPMDLLWVLVLAAIALPAVSAYGRGAAPGLWVLYLGIGVAVGVRRRLPALGCLVGAAATVPVVLSPPDNPDSLLPAALGYALLSWTVALGPRSVPRLAAWALLAAVGLGAAGAYGSDGIGFILAVFAFPYLAALAWGERDAILRRAAERRDVLREEIDRATERAIDAERMRLARELHDVVGHAVGVMVLQAGAAEALLDGSPERSRQALDTVLEAGAEAVTEIDAILTVLDGGERGISGSPPGRLWEALAALVERMRATGMRVRAELGEAPAEPEVAVTVFRVVQEGLTNAARHAPGSAVTVTVRVEGDHWVTRVDNDAGAAGSPVTGGGYGLEGLRERAIACGGSFEAYRCAEGFVVEARLPMRGTDW